MQVRIPSIDYSNLRANWSPNMELTCAINAQTTIPSFIEPWLIKLFRRAKQMVPETNVELRKALDIFVAQEGQHFRQHDEFNRCIWEKYPEAKATYDAIQKEIETWLTDKPMKYCLAYAEGFEALGPTMAKIWFEDFDDYMKDADPQIVALWKWHMAEEFEHREVCFNLFKAIYACTLWGKFWNGWLYRCYGVFFTGKHLGAYSRSVAGILLNSERKGMSEVEVQQSQERSKAYGKFIAAHMLPNMLKTFSPFYNPKHKKPPRGMDAYLARFGESGDLGTVRL